MQILTTGVLTVRKTQSIQAVNNHRTHGVRAMWIPLARNSAPIARPCWSMSSRSQVAAMLTAAGKTELLPVQLYLASAETEAVHKIYLLALLTPAGPSCKQKPPNPLRGIEPVFPRHGPSKPMPVVKLTFSSRLRSCTKALALTTAAAQSPVPADCGEGVTIGLVHCS